MSNVVVLQFSASSRTFTMTVPAAVVRSKGWQGTFSAPPEVRAKRADLPPDTEGTRLCIEDDPETGGFRVYAEGQDKRKGRARAGTRKREADVPAPEAQSAP